ncbi:hypothetical protein ACQV2R_05225 [Facklamia sp. P12937]|uniref:hypothetical protein n=1 Tax=Facklamia sp. P12937 TaxID=3421949 RepID=UPI003D181023
MNTGKLNKIVLNLFDIEPGIGAYELMEKTSIQDTGILKLIIKDLENNCYIVNTSNIKLFTDDIASNFFISPDIRITLEGSNYLNDFDDNTRIFLKELKKLKNKQSELNFLPYLTEDEYLEIVLYAIEEKYISNPTKGKIYNQTREGIVFENNTIVTKKGRDYMNNKNQNQQYPSIINYGYMNTAIGDNNELNIKVNNEGFKSLTEIREFAESLNEDEKSEIDQIIKDIQDNPEEKQNILDKAESILKRYPKLIASLVKGGDYFIAHWSTISQYFGM